MDRLQKLSDHLPSAVAQNIPGLRRGEQQGQQGHFPPSEWSQTSTPINTPPAGLGPAPVFPTPYTTGLPYNNPSQNQNGNGNSYGISEKPAPGSAKTATLLAPAAPVDRPKRWTPSVLRPIIVGPVILFMIVLAVAVEVLYYESQKRNGFWISPKFHAITVVTSFIPVLIVMGVALYINKANVEIMRLQAYINIARGGLPAERTILLDYANLGNLLLIPRAIRFKDYLIALSGAILLTSNLFQSITSSLFFVTPVQYMLPSTTTTSAAVLGLSPDFSDLNTFVAAAGYAEAALLYNLDDPPFVCDGWSTAPFDFQWILNQVAQNGTAAIQTFATLTDPRCSLADSVTEATGGNTWTSTFAGFGASCSATFGIDAGNADTANYGVVKVTNCAMNGTVPDDPFKPIMFWFYTPTGLTSTTWCSPIIHAYHAVANMTLFNSSINFVDAISEVTQGTNFTSGQNLALNGFFFDNTTNPFVTARATAIQSTIPGAIYRYALSLVNGVANNVNDTLLLSIITPVYRQYLATAGQNNFFIPNAFQTPAQINAWQTRLFMHALSTHAFAAVFLLVAILMIVLHILHRNQRRFLYLAGPPGSIGSAVSLTSSARFGALLNAGDTTATMAAKLEGMKFGIDKDTWQIIVERDDLADQEYLDNENGSVLDEKKGTKNSSRPTSAKIRRDSSMVGTVQHAALLSPTSAGFPGSAPITPGPGGRRFDAVGTTTTPTSATFMIPSQGSPPASPTYRPASGGYQPPFSPPPTH